METIAIILSSGIVAAITSVLSVVFMIGQYKQKVDTCEKNIEKHDDKIVNISDRVSKLV